MNRGSCEATRELLPEFALGALTGADAAEVVDHTARCSTCRARLAELSGVTDAMLLLAPETEPTPSFTSRVTAAIDAQPTPGRGSRGRRGWIMAAAAAVVVALVAGGIVVGRVTTAQQTANRTEASEIREQPMIGSGGRPAGNVFLYRGEPAWAVVSVDYGTLPPGEYSIATVSTRADATVGRVSVDGKGRGAWSGTLGDARVHTVRIVDDAGHVLCEASFGHSQSPDDSHS
jgi:Putative zinc-finger